MVIDMASAREIFSKLVERASEHSVGGIECFFNAVPVMTVDVDVKNTRKGSKELQDTEDNIIYVAES